jgi:hypothetical protein
MDIELQKPSDDESVDLALGKEVTAPQKISASTRNALSPAEQEISSQDKNNFAVRERLQFSALCFTLFLAGWNDGGIGPLLPRMMSVYSVRTGLSPLS